MNAENIPQRFEVEIGGGTLAGLRWPSPGKPPLLFCHATGFCASAYKSMLSILSADFDVTALDLRGHGRTRLPADPAALKSWRIHRDDVGAFLDRQAREGWTLAGHSMGAIVSLLTAQGRTDVAALRLIEPVLPPLWMTVMAGTPLWPLLTHRIPLVEQARRRRAEWPDRESAAASYGRKALFAGWAEGVLGDYLEDGLRETADGFALSCSPAWEAATFAAQANPSWQALASLPAPAAVFAADHPSSTVSARGRRRINALKIPLITGAGVSHLAPMEQPALAAGFIAGALKP
ncbi:MAG: alpha/beta hydrolase [Parvularculaceae bacterium]